MVFRSHWNSFGSNPKRQQDSLIFHWQILLHRQIPVKQIISVHSLLPLRELKNILHGLWKTWMIITRSSCRHWLTGSPKHLRNGCTEKCAWNTGDMKNQNSLQTSN